VNLHCERWRSDSEHSASVLWARDSSLFLPLWKLRSQGSSSPRNYQQTLSPRFGDTVRQWSFRNRCHSKKHEVFFFFLKTPLQTDATTHSFFITLALIKKYCNILTFQSSNFVLRVSKLDKAKATRSGQQSKWWSKLFKTIN
jgi:hypothetical protein